MDSYILTTQCVAAVRHSCGTHAVTDENDVIRAEGKGGTYNRGTYMNTITDQFFVTVRCIVGCTDDAAFSVMKGGMAL